MKIPAIISRYVIAAFTVITLFGVFVPLNPKMPESSLDPSWQYAMNEAVARNLSFGRDIIFTYGPYSSLSTRSYDPGTDHLTILGGLILAFSYASLVLYLMAGIAWRRLFVFLLYVAGFLLSRDPLSVSRDALFFSYPLLLVACAVNFLEKPRVWDCRITASRSLAATALLTTPLGLLPLIKGTYLILCGTAMIAVFAYSLYRRQFRLAFIVFVCPIAATFLFWKLSGQAISNLPGYFTGMSQIVSGYTEAMSMDTGHRGEINVFLIAACALLFAVATTRKPSPPGRALLACYLAVFLLIAFKSSFVRHDVHAMIGGCSLVMAAMIVGMLCVDRNLAVALILSFLAWFYIDKNNAKTSTYTVFDNLRNTYAGMPGRLVSSPKREAMLRRRFDHALGEIRKESPVPDLKGSADIYPDEQSAILASNNTWDPRPVFQSYSAYTPELAAINEEHLRGDSAPDNVLFSVDPIDGRLPSLEDGPSWPALLDNYTMTRFYRDNDLAYLRRKPSIRYHNSLVVITSGTCRINEEVAIPHTDLPIFAEIDLEPTFLGRLRGTLFKYPRLEMDLTLRNGKTRSYRVLSNMMRSGYLLSPLVRDTKDFTLLMAGDPDYGRRNAVRSIKIIPRSGSGTLWKSTYILKLEAYQRR